MRPNPPRLDQDGSELSSLLTSVPAPRLTQAARERIWQGTLARRQATGRAWVAIPVAVALLAFVGVGLLYREPGQLPVGVQPPPVAVAPVVEAAPLTVAVASGEVLAGSPIVAAVPGASLHRGARVQTRAEGFTFLQARQGGLLVAPQSELVLEDARSGLQVELASGALTALAVDQIVSVRAGDFEVRALASLVTVDRRRERVEAIRGRSEVLAFGSRVAVEEGECWTRAGVGRCGGAPLADIPAPVRTVQAPAPRIARAVPQAVEPEPLHVEPIPEPVAIVPAPVAPPAPVETNEQRYERALALARQGRHAEASEVLQNLAAGTDTYAALSLYELGRLRQRSLRDPDAALQAFESYRARFPAGTLRQEVALSIIETELERGRTDRAGAEAEAFLSAHPQSERRPQLLLLYANLLRDRGDCARALVEYQRLVQESPVAPQADDAAYFAAFCEARLGRGAAARESLQRYLERYPAGRHRAEAEQALNPAR